MDAEGKALSEKPALKPYWGKPAVRNFRGTLETSASFEARSAPAFYPMAALRTRRPIKANTDQITSKRSPRLENFASALSFLPRHR